MLLRDLVCYHIFVLISSTRRIHFGVFALTIALSYGEFPSKLDRSSSRLLSAER